MCQLMIPMAIPRNLAWFAAFQSKSTDFPMLLSHLGGLEALAQVFQGFISHLA